MEKTAFTRHGWTACLGCGDSIAPGGVDEHECDPARYIDFQVCLAMPEIETIDEHFANLFAFERYCQERDNGAFQEPYAQ